MTNSLKILKICFYIFTLVVQLQAIQAKSISRTDESSLMPRETNFWKGSKFILENGIFIMGDKEARLKKADAGYMNGFGYEYGFIIKKNYYLSFNLTWNFLVPKFKFNKYYVGSGKRIRFVTVPITYAKFGYIKNKFNFLIEIIYLWGIGFSIRRKLTEHAFFEIRNLLWLDQFLEKKPIHGYDSFYILLGLGFKM